MTDKPTPKEMDDLFVEETGFDTDDFPAAIFDFARAVLAKWGQPAQAADSLQEDAARYRFIRDVPYSDDVRSVLVHQQNAAMDRVIDAARKQGASHDR